MTDASPSTVPPARVLAADPAETLCHCRRVSYARVEEAVDREGAHSLADVQRLTTACTRCFGCRSVIEGLLEQRLGESYVRSSVVTIPAYQPSRWERLRRNLRSGRGGGGEDGLLPRRMYMPVLSGFRGRDVTTRLILFNSYDEVDSRAARQKSVSLRADLLDLSGARLGVTQVRVEPRHSAVLDVRDALPPDAPWEGVGVVKLVIEAEQLASFRPYFHFITPTGITSTHEKSAPTREGAASELKRNYYWVFPVGFSPRPEEAYMFLTNTQPVPLDHHELVWQDDAGHEERAPLPALELDQSACVPLHEHFPAIGTGRSAGTVRLSPSTHKVAGWMIRYDPMADLWRAQHL